MKHLTPFMRFKFPELYSLFMRKPWPLTSSCDPEKFTPDLRPISVRCVIQRWSAAVE